MHVFKNQPETGTNPSLDGRDEKRPEPQAAQAFEMLRERLSAILLIVVIVNTIAVEGDPGAIGDPAGVVDRSPLGMVSLFRSPA